MGGTNQWSKGLCGADCGTCCFWWFVPCIALPTARTKYDDSNCFFNFCCLNHASFVNIIREGYGIEGNCCADILLSLFCGICIGARAQTEIELRGPITPPRGEQPWQFQLGDCFSDIKVCLLAYFFGPCVLAAARTEYDESNCFFNAICMSAAVKRNVIRDGLGKEGNCCMDIIFPMVPVLGCMDIIRIYRETKAGGKRSAVHPSKAVPA